MVKFVFARLRRSTLSEIIHKPVFQHVHNHLPFPVPTSVLLLLSKGLKYVPDLQSAHWTDFNVVGKKLQKALDCRAFFGDRPMPPKRFAKLRLQSSWSPPATARGKLVHNMFRHAIEQWHPVAKTRNWSFWDRQAMKWLKQHRSTVKVCDSDKNMGVSLHTQQWVRARSLEHIRQACTLLSHDEWTATTRIAIRDAEQVLTGLRKAGLCTDAEIRYMRSFFEKPSAGLFRLLPKLHKNPISSRPVFTSGKSIFRGLSEWLVVLLEPMLKHYFTIATNSDEVQAHLQSWSEEWRNHSGFCSWPTLQFATLDIESLYPSIDLAHLRQVIKSQIFKYYDGEKARQVAALLDLVLRINDIAFEGEIYRICKGLPTGSPVSVVLANLYLVELDATLRGTPGLCFYKRYIDDLLLLLSRDCLVDVIARLHSFHPNIRVQLSAQGNQNIPFLDLQLSIDDQARISHELFIKPQNLFHYVPFTSCHPPFVFKGVVQGEFQRYVRRCSSQKVADVHVRSLRQRLLRRGYPHALLAQNTVRRVQRYINKPVLPVHAVIRYSRSVNPSRLREVLRPIQRIMPQLRLSFRVQKSLFRLLYAQWQ